MTNYYPLYTDPLWWVLTVWLGALFIGGIILRLANNHRR